MTAETTLVPGPRSWILGAVALLLFLIWSNTFVAIGYLLGAEQANARFDWVSLTTARFAPVFLVCLVYCILPRRWQASVAVVRVHWKRLLVAGLCAVPAYNLSLYFGQEHGVPAPIASLTTTLAPIFILVFSILFLEERLTRAKVVGLVLCVAGMGVIASARRAGASVTYPLVVAITALAPLSWSIFSVVTKRVSGIVDPVHWTYLALVFGCLPGVLALPWSGGAELLRLDVVGWASLLYLSVLATVLGFALWTWLLRYMPASTVGLTIFLNPPLTTVSKLILASAWPSTFTFKIAPLEVIGGLVVLSGVAISLLRRK